MNEMEGRAAQGHEYFEQLCSNGVDGTLTEAERLRLEEHLKECPSCAALLRELSELRALLENGEEPPKGLHEDIMQRVRQEERLRVVQPERPVRHLPALAMVASAAVVVLAVLGGGIGSLFGTIGAGGNMAASGSDAAAPEAASAAFDDKAASGGAGAFDYEGGGMNMAPEASTDSGAPTGKARQEEQGVPAAEEDIRAANRQADSVAPAESPQDFAMQSDTPAANGAAVLLPDSVQGMSVAHCYVAAGGGELPDLDGELLAAEDGGQSCFLLPNSMSVLENTLAAMEDAGYEVASYEGASLTLDSKAEYWMLIVLPD